MAHIHSMTGFGKAMLQLPAKKITIEVKSLNSKQTDINVRIPSLYKEKEQDIRQLAVEMLDRGKIDIALYCEITGTEKGPQINGELVRSYISQLKSIADETGIQGDILNTVMRFPDALRSAEDEIDPEEWKAVYNLLSEAFRQLNEFRREEGAKLERDFYERLATIRQKMESMTDFEEDRMIRVKERILRSLNELKEAPDENRFEQELIFYLEKLDITEEKVRLNSHLEYFENLLEEGGPIGKKLGFIAQEIGREINTMGSKANHAPMQKLVVEMKDELEKIKEQVLNIL